MDFSIYATWTYARQVPADQEAALGATVDELPGDTCVYVDHADPTLLHATFDLAADSYDTALNGALTALQSAALGAELTGHLSRVVAMTDEGQAEWHPPT